MDCNINTYSYSLQFPFDQSFYLYFNCNGVISSSAPFSFSDASNALMWAQENWGSFGTWALDGSPSDTIILTGSTCSTGRLFYEITESSSVDEIILTDTGSAVNRNIWGVTAENMNLQTGNDPTWYDIFNANFCANVDLFEFEFLIDWNTSPNHYGVRYTGDRPDIPPPMTPGGRVGGFNTTIRCNTESGDNVTYPVSFWSYEVKWCIARGMKMMLSCNINDFSIPAYLDNMSYTDAQVGLIGIVVMDEYESPGWCSCALCNNGTGIISAAQTLINGVHASYPDIFYTSDWKGINSPTAALEDGYTNLIKGLTNKTGTRIYLSEDKLISAEDRQFGKTGPQYLVIIDNSIDNVLANRITELNAITGLPVDVLNVFSLDLLIAWGRTYLQYYFVIRAYMKLIVMQANDPSTINYAAWRRFDNVDAKTTINDLGKAMILLKGILNPAWNVFEVEIMDGVFAVAGSDGTTGAMIVCNPLTSSLPFNSVMVGSSSLQFTSITSLYGNNLLATDLNYGTTDTVKGISISLVTF